ncbi:hypothetical protein N9529_02230 [Crocinitomicaceae bacterium]|nr:hypothetical protein [Crocinitomicaceae bacterium]MDC0099920.1 hypothetical protein [Crocinitomicaceae bacterium]MDC1385448.1 hypothetical protein [Crocinitomicaceae bacterium]
MISLKPDSANYNYRKGYIAVNSHKETGAPFDVYYDLSKFYHINDDLDKAREFYNLFLANSNNNSVNIASSQIGLKQCDVAEREFKNS